MVGIQKSIHVVDMTSQALAKKAPKLNADGSVDASAVTPLEAKEGVHRLPAGLTQEELHVPSEEKDVYAYYYLNKVPLPCRMPYNLLCVQVSFSYKYSSVVCG